MLRSAEIMLYKNAKYINLGKLCQSVQLNQECQVNIFYFVRKIFNISIYRLFSRLYVEFIF
jgi:hypothetical protein